MITHNITKLKFFFSTILCFFGFKKQVKKIKGVGLFELDISYYIDRCIFVNHGYESDSIFRLIEILKTYDLKHFSFLDIGSNIGLYAIAIKSNFPGSKVFAFEPTSFTFARLIKNIEINNLRISASKKAISNFNGTSKLYHSNSRSFLYGENSGMNSLEYSQKKKRTDNFGYELIDVISCKKLLELLPKDQVLIIKLDIEEHEFTVLQDLLPIIHSKSLTLFQVELLWSEPMMVDKCDRIHSLLLENDFRAESEILEKKSGNYIYLRNF